MNRIIGIDLARGPDKTGVLIRPGRQAGKSLALKDQVKEWLATGATVLMGNGREMNRVVGVVDDPNTRLIEAKTMRDPKLGTHPAIKCRTPAIVCDCPPGCCNDATIIPTTCPRCGATAAAFQCSESDCPVNGGAAYA